MTDFSIDVASRNIYDARTRSIFEEVKISYYNGCYRSSIVMLWAVIVSDLVFKLKDLKDVYGDANAVNILNDIQRRQTNNSKDSSWEKHLLDEVNKKTQIINEIEYGELSSIQELRHLSAHPILSHQDVLYEPNKDKVRAAIRCSMETLLLKPPLFSNKIFETILMDLELNKIYLIKSDDVKSFLEARYFKNINLLIESKIFRSLWKICFADNSPKANENREINVKALVYLFDRNFLSKLELIKNERAYYSNLKSDKSLLKALVSFLNIYHEIFHHLDDSAKTIIKNYIESNPNYQISCHYIYDSFEKVLEKFKGLEKKHILSLRPNFFKKLLKKANSEKLQDELYSICIEKYGNAISYDEADDLFNLLIKDIVEHFNQDLIEKLCHLISSDSQLRDRRRAKQDHKMIEERAKNLLMDISKYELS